MQTQSYREWIVYTTAVVVGVEVTICFGANGFPRLRLHHSKPYMCVRALGEANQYRSLGRLEHHSPKSVGMEWQSEHMHSHTYTEAAAVTMF